MLLVTGAAGGVGLAAVKLGKVLGARVIGAVGSEAKKQVVLDRGAETVINYSTENLKDRVKELTGGQGADVILDVVGGDVFDQCMRCINLLGRILVLGFASGRIPTVATNLPLLKNCAIMGVFFGGWMTRDHAGVKQMNEALLALAAKGLIPAHISQRFPLADAVQAMDTLLGRETTGKIILQMS